MPRDPQTGMYFAQQTTGQPAFVQQGTIGQPVFLVDAQGRRLQQVTSVTEHDMVTEISKNTWYFKEHGDFKKTQKNYQKTSSLVILSYFP